MSYLNRIYGLGRKPEVVDYFIRERKRQLANPEHWGKGTHAESAYRFAQHLVELDKLEDSAERTYEWRGDYEAYLTFDLDDIQVRVYIDDEPMEWGDIEPTQEEIDSIRDVIGVGVRLKGAEDDLGAIWGVVVTKDDDTDRVALSTALEYGFIDHARKTLETKRIINTILGEN